MSTINFTFKINGTLLDVDSIYLEDKLATYGVRRVDTLDVIVASHTQVPRVSLGTYKITFADPEPNLTYEYNLKIVYQGSIYWFSRRTVAAEQANLISIPTTDYYSSQAEVYRLGGEYAVELMMEDFLSEDKGYMWVQFLQSADDTIKMYVGQHYDPDLLYTNQWIRAKATWLVWNLLSQRRGNHPLSVSQTDRVYEELNMIRDGRFHIPGAKPRAWQGPMWSNYLMQSRSINNPVRVEQSKSVKSGYNGRELAWEPFWFSC